MVAPQQQLMCVTNSQRLLATAAEEEEVAASMAKRPCDVLYAAEAISSYPANTFLFAYTVMWHKEETYSRMTRRMTAKDERKMNSRRQRRRGILHE